MTGKARKRPSYRARKQHHQRRQRRVAARRRQVPLGGHDAAA